MARIERVVTKHTATFFLSAGRCGTQTLHNAIEQCRPDAVVQHEAIRGDFRYYDRAVGFLDAIVDVLETKDFIMTGWPSYPWLRFYQSTLGDNMKVIRLTRDIIDQKKSLEGHDLANRTDDLAMMVPNGSVGDHMSLVRRTMADFSQSPMFTFDQLFDDNFWPYGRRLLMQLLGIIDEQKFFALLETKVDAYPSKKGGNAEIEGA